MNIKHILLIWILICVTAMASLESNMWDRIKEGSTVGWSVWYTGQDPNDLTSYDKFKSVARIHSDSNAPCGDLRHDDEIWVVVDRTIDGTVESFIEVFTPLDWGDDDDYCWFVDCGGAERNVWIPGTPEVPGVDVWGDYSQYVVGVSPYSGDKIVLMGKDDSTIVTTWGDEGYWDATPNDGPCFSMYQLSDGRILVGHNYYKVSMINTDGTTDTSWATNGVYTMQSSGANVRSILEDNDGNFHFFGGLVATTARYVYEKCDSDGTYLDGMTRGETKAQSIYGAVWYDSTKTRIIAGGSSIDTLAGLRPNLIAIDPVTCTIDTDWTGNVPDNPGFAQFDEVDYYINYHIYQMSDGGTVLYRNTDNTLCKVLPDGSAVDTTWGSSGFLDLGSIGFPSTEGHNPTQDGDNLYIITYVNDGGANFSRFSLIDSDGVITDTYDATGVTYKSVSVFNDQLLFGNGNDVELWDADFTYISKFEVANSNSIWWIIPDETTREHTTTPAVPAVPGYWDTLYGYMPDEVCVYADGVSLGTFDVNSADANDIIGIDETAYDVIIAGINYYSIYESFPLVASEIARNQRTVTQRVALDLYQTKGVNLGTSMAYSSPIEFADVNDLYTGFKIAEFPRGTFREPVIYLWEWEPYPWCLRAAYMRESIIIPE